jgi:hypothetical protein
MTMAQREISTVRRQGEGFRRWKSTCAFATTSRVDGDTISNKEWVQVAKTLSFSKSLRRQRRSDSRGWWMRWTESTMSGRTARIRDQCGHLLVLQPVGHSKKRDSKFYLKFVSLDSWRMPKMVVCFQEMKLWQCLQRIASILLGIESTAGSNYKSYLREVVFPVEIHENCLGSALSFSSVMFVTFKFPPALAMFDRSTLPYLVLVVHTARWLFRHDMSYFHTGIFQFSSRVLTTCKTHRGS